MTKVNPELFKNLRQFFNDKKDLCLYKGKRQWFIGTKITIEPFPDTRWKEGEGMIQSKDITLHEVLCSKVLPVIFMIGFTKIQANEILRRLTK